MEYRVTLLNFLTDEHWLHWINAAYARADLDTLTEALWLQWIDAAYANADARVSKPSPHESAKDPPVVRL